MGSEMCIRDSFVAALFHRSSKWLAARCLLASRFLVFFLFGVVLARPFFPQFSPVDSKAVQRVHCVDLGESFPTSIYLQNLASIQPRASLVKFARSPRTDPPGSTVWRVQRAGAERRGVGRARFTGVGRARARGRGP